MTVDDVVTSSRHHHEEEVEADCRRFKALLRDYEESYSRALSELLPDPTPMHRPGKFRDHAAQTDSDIETTRVPNRSTHRGRSGVRAQQPRSNREREHNVGEMRDVVSRAHVFKRTTNFTP